jgi:hypothetical protein
MKIRSSLLALFAALCVASPNPSLQAAPIVQTLATGDMTSSQFNSLFTPIASAPTLSAAYQFMRTPVSGMVESQVFQGTGAAAGLYAYAYQFVVNPVIDYSGQPTSLNSASFAFNATPIASNLIDGSSSSYSAYVIQDGAIGGIGAPRGGPSGMIQAPSAITLMSGTSAKTLTVQYLDPRTGSGPLEAGAHSATIVVISTIPFTTQSVSLQNADPQISYPIAYTPTGINVPEPSTILGWAAAISGLALFRLRNRRGRSLA